MAHPEGDGVVWEIEVAVAQVELDRRAADCDGLRRGYGLTPWGLEGFRLEELRDECGGCGEAKACAKEMAAGEQQVLLFVGQALKAARCSWLDAGGGARVTGIRFAARRTELSIHFC